MKSFPSLVVAGVMAAGLLSGCGKQETAPPAAPAPAPTPIAVKPAPVPAPAPVAVQPAPAPVPVTAVPAVTAPASTSAMDLLTGVKGDVEKAYALAKDSKYQDALTVLADKAVAVKNNPEAMKLINDATTQIKKMMADSAVKQAGSTATKAVGDLFSK